MAADGSGSKVDELRVTRGIWVVAMCIVLVLAFFAVAVIKFSTLADITAMVGLATTFSGTIIGAYFGVQAGSSGKEKAENARDKAELKAEALAAAHPDPAKAEAILAQFR